jgi:hypothetical protein
VSEPQTTAALAVAGGFSLVAGTVLGLPIAAVVFGLAGTLWSIKSDRELRTLWQRVASVVLGTMLAAVAAHPAASVVQPAGPANLLVGTFAFLIGTGAEVLIRAGLRAMVNRIHQAGGVRDEGGSS